SPMERPLPRAQRAPSPRDRACPGGVLAAAPPAAVAPRDLAARARGQAEGEREPVGRPPCAAPLRGHLPGRYGTPDPARRLGLREADRRPRRDARNRRSDAALAPGRPRAHLRP